MEVVNHMRYQTQRKEKRMNRHQFLCEMEERFNELEQKRKRGGLSRSEEQERKAIIRWQTQNHVLATMQEHWTSFLYLDEVA